MRNHANDNLTEIHDVTDMTFGRFMILTAGVVMWGYFAFALGCKILEAIFAWVGL